MVMLLRCYSCVSEVDEMDGPWHSSTLSAAAVAEALFLEPKQVGSDRWLLIHEAALRDREHLRPLDSQLYGSKAIGSQVKI